MMDLVHSHKYPRLYDLQKEKKWAQKEGMEVSDRVGKRAGILGYGSIGRQGEFAYLPPYTPFGSFLQDRTPPTRHINRVVPAAWMQHRLAPKYQRPGSRWSNIPHAMPSNIAESPIAVMFRSHQLLTPGLNRRAMLFGMFLDPSERLMQLTGILHTPPWWSCHLHVTDNRFSFLSQHASDAGRNDSRPSYSFVARWM
jgi:hypothetical protein